MPGIFSTASGFKPSWGSRLGGIGAALQGRDYQDPELESYLAEQRQKRFFEERGNAEETAEDKKEKRGIRYLTTAAKALAGDATPEQKAEQQYANAASEGLLTSLVGAERAKAILPKVAQVAQAMQGQELAAAETGTELQGALGDKTRAMRPHMSTIGETEALADIEGNKEKASTSRLTTATNTALEGNEVPAWEAGARASKAQAAIEGADVDKLTSLENVRQGMPKQRVAAEGAKSRLEQTSATQDLEDLLATRPDQIKLIDKTLKNKLLEADTKARLIELQTKALEGDLSTTELQDLRNIVLGLYRPMAQSTKLDGSGKGMTPLRTPEEDAWIREVAEEMAASQSMR